MMKGRPISYVLVAVQFACMGAILLSGPWVAEAWVWRVAEAAGLALGLWAVVVMRPGRFNVIPDPKQDARLVARGPYAWIRHPMYTSVLLATGALVADAPTGWRVAVWLVLLAGLLVKLRYEEGLLRAQVDGYAAYMERTHRLVPWVY